MQTKSLQRKRALRTALLVLLLSAVGMGKGYAYDFSAVCETGQSLYYNIIGANLVELTSPNGVGWNGFEKPIGNISLPESVQFEGAYYAVTGISAFAFYDCQELTGDLVIPNSVITIGMCAFANCTGLTGDLVIPNSVTTIGEHAFSDCTGLSGTLTLPNSITEIKYRAFYGCGFSGNLIIPNAVTYIAYEAFADCSGFTSLFISQSVTSLQGGSFLGCSGLAQIIIDDNNPVYDSRNNCNAIIETSTNTLVRACSTTTIPNTVTAIADDAFYGCTGLNGGLVIPNSISTIGPYAFAGCAGLTGDLVIPNSVTTIGEGAFAGCTGLTGTLTLPNSITEIERRVFEYCGFTGNLVIPNSVVAIGDEAFAGCTGFTGHLVIPSSVTIINEFTFAGCIGITSVYLPQSILKISKGAFYKCTGLKGELVLPDFVIIIGASAFVECTSITGVTIGKYIQGIGDGAFHECPSIESVTILATQLPELYGGGHYGLDVYGFYNDPSIPILRVPCGYKSLYEEWGCANEFSTIIEDCDLHAISINNASSNSGSISLSANSANLGDEVQITVTPNTDMSLSSLTVCNANDPSQTVPVYPIGKATSTYGFNMPYYDVIVKVVFAHGNAVGEGNSIAASIYPNPTNGQMKIEAEGIKHVTISNALGQVVYEDKTEGDAFEYDFNKHGAGIYLVRIETANGVAMKKVSVTR